MGLKKEKQVIKETTRRIDIDVSYYDFAHVVFLDK
jgi:hypothetical protein